MALFQRGDSGPVVAEVQAALVSLGLLTERAPHAVFDAETERALREFQQRRGLSVDGLVG